MVGYSLMYPFNVSIAFVQNMQSFCNVWDYFLIDALLLGVFSISSFNLHVLRVNGGTPVNLINITTRRKVITYGIINSSCAVTPLSLTALGHRPDPEADAELCVFLRNVL